MKGNKVKSVNENEDNASSRSGRRFYRKWKFQSRKSMRNINHSSTVENGLNAIFVRAIERRKPGSTTDNAVNNSLVSLGFAVANTNTRDLYKVR